MRCVCQGDMVFPPKRSAAERVAERRQVNWRIVGWTSMVILDVVSIVISIIG